MGQEQFRVGDVDGFHRFRGFIKGLGGVVSDKDDSDDDDGIDGPTNPPPSLFKPFFGVMDNTVGNLFLENPLSLFQDPNLSSVKYARMPCQHMALILQPIEEALRDGIIDND